MPFMRWQNLGACVKDLTKQYSPDAALAVCRRLEARSKEGGGNEQQQQQRQQPGQQQPQQRQPPPKRR